MHVGIATDHGGFALKGELVARIRAAGHNSNPDHYRGCTAPLAHFALNCEHATR